MTMRLSDLEAIDVHTHAMVSANGAAESPEEREQRELASRHFGAGAATDVTADDVAAHYRERRMAAVIFPLDNGSSRAEPGVSSEEVAEAAARHPDVLIPFASIDPWSQRLGARRVRTLVERHGVRGFKFHPSLQEFYPNDRRMYPIYEAIAETGLPALFHTGQTGMGAGAPGGLGVRIKYSNPLYLDDVAADFPTMPIIMAHPSVPWQDEALAVAVHKHQVHIDLSGWSPRYFPPTLVHYANTLLKDRVLFGTDYPLLTPERWLRDFEDADFKDEVRPLILRENAARLLGIS